MRQDRIDRRCALAATASRTSVPAATGCRRLSAACAARPGNATSQAPASRSARRARHGPPRAAPGAGLDRPPAARWPEGPVCDPCYTAALRSRGPCAHCGQTRRLVAPPGPCADTCADCAGIPVTHACCDCGLEDKLYERGRCDRCSLSRRTRELLSAGLGDVPSHLTARVRSDHAPRASRAVALNWLRSGARCHPARRHRRRAPRRNPRGAGRSPTSAGR